MTKKKEKETVKPPNQMQVRYATQRIDAILALRVHKAKAGAGKGLPKRLTVKDKINLIRNGKAGKMKVPAYSEEKFRYNRDACPSLIECYDWPQDVAYREACEKARIAAEEEVARLNERAQELKDSLILGDALKTLEMIQEFESGN